MLDAQNTAYPMLHDQRHRFLTPGYPARQSKMAASCCHPTSGPWRDIYHQRAGVWIQWSTE